MHDGHCAAGWIGGNTAQNDVGACFRHCEQNIQCGYFAYAASLATNNCAMYTAAGSDFNQPMLDHAQTKQHESITLAFFDKQVELTDQLVSAFQ